MFNTDIVSSTSCSVNSHSRLARDLAERTHTANAVPRIQFTGLLPLAFVSLQESGYESLERKSCKPHPAGFSVIDKADDSSPEIPDYNRLASSKQIWRDLIGNYTRFGDVRELLDKIDDRYVIMNAGDEMSFRFKEQPPPPAGWMRDFIIVGDGWIKDGDYNSTFSKTVQPLPYHDKNQYVIAPGRLEDEEVYRRHPEDWQKYHTRYVTPDVFHAAI